VADCGGSVIDGAALAITLKASQEVHAITARAREKVEKTTGIKVMIVVL
jgi:hypothetical protein